jgi:alpha-beta hydrolase superfamily lysophospholipase
VEEGKVRTVVLPDARGEGRSLRVTWHPSNSTVVFSHWVGAMCTASTRVSAEEAARLVELLRAPAAPQSSTG